jgi:BirA family biotin operon repressor/biotin-[acetyl-CoA-carboxylase] ligase
LLKNSNLLPDPGKEKHHSTTFDNQLIELESVDSTNNYAMARIHEGMAFDGLAYIARHQWAGKGQRGKKWLSEPGQNLSLSLVIEPRELILSQQFLFSAAVTLGILDFVQGLKKGKWHVKWPNDIYWRDRKAAGVLIESIIKGEIWQFSVVGIGINLNQEIFPEKLPNAISLKNITGKNYEPVVLAKELILLIQNRITILRKKPNRILNNFNRSLYKKNSSIKFKKGSDIIEAILIGVDSSGFLLTDKGSFNAGEISFVLSE